jgi:replicative DNA helicase
MSTQQVTEGELLRHAAYLLLEDTDFLRAFRGVLKPEHFKAPELHFLAEFALDFYERHRLAPGLESFKIELDEPQRAWSVIGVQPELMDALVNALEEDGAPSTGVTAYVRDRLEYYIKVREFEQAVRTASYHLDEGEVDKAFDVVRAAQQVRANKDEYLVFPDDLDKVLEYFAPERLDRVSISTGIPGLDLALGGGLRPGELGVMMGPLKRGKSMALVQLGASALRRNVSVVHYSLENSAEDTYGRYMAHLVGESVETALREHVTGSELHERARVQLQRIDSDAQVFIRWFPAKVTSVSDIESDLEELLFEHRIGLVVIDYGDLARSRQRHERAYEEQADVFLELRNLGMTTGLPVWTATQSNRQSLNTKDVVISQIAESLGKAMKADFVVAMSQTPEEAKSKPPLLRLDVVAARRGRPGIPVTVQALFDHAQLLEPIPPEDEDDEN